MKVLKTINEISEDQKLGLTIGNFDGLHLGHRDLLSDVKKRCLQEGLSMVVVTFVPHPVMIISPKTNFLINTYEERRCLLESLEVDFLLEINFSRDVSTLSPKDFLDSYLFLKGNIQQMHLGYDFAFGANKSGDHEFVGHYCKEKDVDFFVHDKFQKNGQTISSSLVRETLKEGKVQEAQDYLDRPFFLKGRVVKGAGRGKQIGFPTANMDYSVDRLLPKEGVYITKTQYRESFYFSLTNIGKNPTFGQGNPVNVETHLLDFNLDIYGEPLEVHFLKRVRDEMKFNSVNELIDQIKCDVQTCKDYIRNV